MPALQEEVINPCQEDGAPSAQLQPEVKGLKFSLYGCNRAQSDFYVCAFADSFSCFNQIRNLIKNQST